MKTIFSRAPVRWVALALAAAFLSWNIAAIVGVLRRSARTVEAIPLAEKMEALANSMAEELSRQGRQSEFTEGAAASAERMDRFLRLWNEYDTKTPYEAAGQEIRERRRRAGQWMSMAWVTRGRLNGATTEEQRRLIESEFRAFITQALAEVRTSLGEIRNPPRESFEAEQRGRLADLVLTLVFGLAVLGALIASMVGTRQRTPAGAGWAALWFQHSREAVLALDREGVIRAANPAALELFGYSEGEARGKPLAHLLPMAGRKQGKVAAGGPALELRVTGRRRNGQPIMAQVTLSKYEEEGEFHGIAIVRELTAPQAAAPQVTAPQVGALQAGAAAASAPAASAPAASQDKPPAVELAGDALQLPRKLAEKVAESFSHHLTAINGYSELLLEALAPGDPNRDDVEEIRRSGERAAAVTGQLQYFSGRAGPTLSEVAVTGLAKGLERRLRALLPANIELTFHIGEDAGVVAGDAAELEQAVVSLVLNAQDAMPAGGKLTVETSTVQTEDRGWWSTLAVIDTGKGMDEETKARLFQPLFPTRAEGRGAGLGLAVVSEIVRRHHGAIDVKSAPGKGSTFRIYLPRADQPSADQPSVDQPSALPARQETEQAAG